MSTIYYSKTTGAAFCTALMRHACLILSFRHRGSEVDMGGTHMLLLGVIASLLAGVPAMLSAAGGPADFSLFCQATLIAGIAMTVFYVVLGRKNAAAMIILILFSAPVEIALLLLADSPHLFILVSKLWFFSAQAVFVLRADRVTVGCQ